MGSETEGTPRELKAITGNNELAGGDISQVMEQAINEEYAGSDNSNTSQLAEEQRAQMTTDKEEEDSEKASEIEGKHKKKRGRLLESTNKSKGEVTKEGKKEGEQQILNFLVNTEIEKKEDRSTVGADGNRRIARSNSVPKLNVTTNYNEGRQTTMEMNAFFFYKKQNE